MTPSPPPAADRAHDRPPTRVFGAPSTPEVRPKLASALAVPVTPARPAGMGRTLKASAPRMDLGSRIPVSGVMSALGWAPGDVYARVQDQTMVVTRDPQPFATRTSIDSRARLIVSPAGRSALAVTAGDLVLVVTVDASGVDAAHLVVSSLQGVAAEFLDSHAERHE